MSTLQLQEHADYAGDTWDSATCTPPTYEGLELLEVRGPYHQLVHEAVTAAVQLELAV